MEKRVKIGITHGDINGIGYEVILKTLAEPRVLENIVPVIYGSSKVAAFYRKSLDIQGININQINHASEAQAKKINLINCGSDDLKVELGKSTPEAGKSAFDALEKATADLDKGDIHALVTAPINKKNIQTDEFKFPGHTEYLEEKLGNGAKALMLMATDSLRVAVQTGHIPIEKVPSAITAEKIVETLNILNQTLKEDFTVIRPRIAVLGLNPHAGDEGVIGKEDMEVIRPAIIEADKKGIICFGPIPADGFFGSGEFQKYDAVLAMYHDQGLIPFKTLAAGQGVNYTAGLPVIRTSPAHGTAYSLAGKNEADESSFRDALFMAYDIYLRRETYKEINSNPLKVEPKVNNKPNRIA